MTDKLPAEQVADSSGDSGLTGSEPASAREPSATDDMELALHIAAQAWCTPETSSIEMDTRLAQAFADDLVLWIADVKRYARDADFWREGSELAEEELDRLRVIGRWGTVIYALPVDAKHPLPIELALHVQVKPL